MKVIAEIGVNHDGKIEKAKKLIKVSKKNGADFVKFQLYKTENIVTYKSKVSNYQKKITKNQYKLLKKYELTIKDFKVIFNYCKKIKIKPLTTCFDVQTFLEINKNFNQNIYKIGSGDLDNLPLIYQIAKFKKKLILSTGMSNLKDINLALKTIIYAHKFRKNIPEINKIKKIKLNNKSINYLKDKVVLLHCVSNYPTKIQDLNLNVIKFLKKKYNLTIGLSDHTKSNISASVAFLLGAKFFEKHITISNNSFGPDHKSSLNEDDFNLMMKNLSETKKMLGSSKKSINKSEYQISKVARKSLYASKNIKNNEKFSYSNIGIKRPQKGKKPLEIWKLIGKTAKRSYKKNELL